MEKREEKIGMNLAIEINNKGNNMTLKYFYDATNYSFKEDDGGYLLTIDIPGVKKSELNISVLRKNEQNILAVKSENKDRKYDQEFSLSNRIDEKTIKASLSEGVLKIKMKPKEEASNKYKIEID
jgi:HSP20 family protein